MNHQMSPHVAIGGPVRLSCHRSWDIIAWEKKKKAEPSGSLGSTWKPDGTHTTLQFSKFTSKNEVSTTTERLTGWEVLCSSWSPQALWALPELAQETTSFLHNRKEKFEQYYCVHLASTHSYSCWEDWGIYQSGAEPGLLEPGPLSKALHTAQAPSPLKATYVLGVLFTLAGHMHQWSCHHLHFIA